MSDEIKQSVDVAATIITASAGVVGVILGSVISSIVSWKMKTKELQLKFVEQIFQKRINAYEKLLDFIQLMRSTMVTGFKNENGYAITSLAIYAHKNQHDIFQEKLYDVFTKHCHFLNYQIYVELYYIQTLEVNLSNIFTESNVVNWEKMSLLIKSDYIKCAERLNDLALQFFEKEIYSIRIKTSRGDYDNVQDTIKKYLEKSDYSINYKELIEYLK